MNDYNIDYDRLEELINTSKYGSVTALFDAEEKTIGIGRMNYYKVKRTTGNLKPKYINIIAELIGFDTKEVYAPITKKEYPDSEVDLLRQMVADKDEIIYLLKDKLDKLDKLDKSQNNGSK